MQRVAGILASHNIKSALEAGTGEATKLAQLGQIAGPAIALSGFDISLGRMLLAEKFLKRLDVEAECFCADMNDIPLPDNSVEAVVTFGAVEPNRGKEAKILGELARVASRLLALVEPDYDRGTPAQRAHGSAQLCAAPAAATGKTSRKTIAQRAARSLPHRDASLPVAGF